MHGTGVAEQNESLLHIKKRIRNHRQEGKRIKAINILKWPMFTADEKPKIQRP